MEALSGSADKAVLTPALVVPLKKERSFLAFDGLAWGLVSSDSLSVRGGVSGWIAEVISPSVASSGRVWVSGSGGLAAWAGVEETWREGGGGRGAREASPIRRRVMVS